MRPVPLAAAMLLLAGCYLGRHRGAAPVPQRGTVRDTLIRADLARTDSVVSNGFVRGMMGMLSPDVVYLRAGVPAVYGREAVGRLLTSSPPPPGDRFQWQPLGGGLAADGLSAYTFGVAARYGAQRESVARLDRYIAFWRRQSRAPWRIEAYVEVGPAHFDAPPGTITAVDRTPPPPGTGEGGGRDEATIISVLQSDVRFARHADRDGVPAAFAFAAAPDAVLFAGPEIVVGPRAIREQLETRRASLSWQPVHAGVSNGRDLGYTVGEYVSTVRNPNGVAEQRFGKYLTVWRVDRKRVWKFVVDGGNESPMPGGGGPGSVERKANNPTSDWPVPIGTQPFQITDTIGPAKQRNPSRELTERRRSK